MNNVDSNEFYLLKKVHMISDQELSFLAEIHHTFLYSGHTTEISDTYSMITTLYIVYSAGVLLNHEKISRQQLCKPRFCLVIALNKNVPKESFAVCIISCLIKMSFLTFISLLK